MNKKIIIGIVIAVIIVFLGTLGYFLINDNKQKESESSSTNNPLLNEDKNNDDEEDDANNDNSAPSEAKKILVVYYSASGSTKRVAEEISKNLNADIFEIEPVEPYTSADLNWSDSNSRVTKEHNDESLRDVPLKNTKVPNWTNYDTILIGYPIWWGIAAWPVNNFVKDNDFSGKTVIPFCTSASSSLGQSGNLLAEEAQTGSWQEGHRFSSGATSSDIKKWTDSLK